MAEQSHHEIGGGALGDEDDENRGEQRGRSLDDDPRVEQHADRDEEQHGEGVAQREAIPCAACWLNRDSLKIMPAKKAPSASDTPNSSEARPRRSRARSTARQAGTVRGCRYGRRNAGSSGITFRPTTSMMMRKAAILPSVSGWPGAASKIAERALHALEHAGEHRQEHEHQDHEDVLDDEPADGDAAALGVEQPPSLAGGAAAPQCSPPTARCRKSRPAIGVQPCHQPTIMPSGAATSACAAAPGMAMARTESRSSSEKCKPTPNISRMTPISAS